MESSSPNRTRVCVLQCTYEGSDSCWKDIDPYCCPEGYDTGHKYEWSSVHIHKATAVRQVRDLAQSGTVDVFLNLCDGAFDEDRAGAEVVEALERYGCCYTGADRVFYEPSKALQKKQAYYYGVSTAPWALITRVDKDNTIAAAQCSAAVAQLRYPLIVKHYNGGGSVGMGRDCRVTDLQGLVQQVQKFVGTYGGALVEEFVEGREFTVLVVENAADPDHPIALTPVECIFGQGETFKHFDLKWHDYESMSWQPVDAQAEPELVQGLQHAACEAFVALQGCSYGRADFRVDAAGTIYFLEHNPNCGIFYPPDAMGSADYILTLCKKMDHAGFLDAIIAAAQRRHAHKSLGKPVEVLYRQGQGYGLYATRDIPAGQTVIKYEETPHVLVSAHHVRKVFGEGALLQPPTCAASPAPAAQPTHQLSALQTAGKARRGSALSTCSTSTAADSTSCSMSSNAVTSLSVAASSGMSHHMSRGGGCSSADLSACSSEAEEEEPPSNGIDGPAAYPVMLHKQADHHAGVHTDISTECGYAPPSKQQHSMAAATTAGLVSQNPRIPTSMRCLDWFRAYAYPITDETWVTWSADPDAWLPLNHSCDPCAWLDGLDLTARRDIKEGEQITADYATFTVHNMRPFECNCGAARCRRNVTGTDYLAPWVEEWYGNHMSDYVASKRKQHA